MTPWIQVAGWTLVHFVWQGAVVAAIAALTLRLLHSGSASARYLASCAALAFMIALPLATVIVMSSLPARLAIDMLPLAAAQGGALPASTAAPRSATDGWAPLVLRSSVDAALPMLVISWLAGVAVLLTRVAGGWWRVRRLHRLALRAPSSSWQAAADRLAVRLGIGRVVRVVDWPSIHAPTVLGWIRPVVLLPIAALATLTPAQVEAILVHELAHVRRHDYLVNLMQSLAETFLFYHPAVWWISGRIRAEREHCCDDVVVRVCGDATGYAKALVEIASRHVGPEVLAVAATGGPLLARVRRLLGEVEPDRRLASNGVATAALVLLFIAIAAGVTHVSGFGASSQVDLSRAPASPPPPPDLALQPPDWRTVESDHFSITYTADIEGQVARVAAEADRAYRQVAASLRHDLAFKPTLVLMATRGDIERALESGVGWRTTAERERIVISIDIPAGRLYADLVHEISHAFAFDIIPRSTVADLPGWINEGLAEYQRGQWDDGDRALVAELLRTASVPPISGLSASTFPGHPRLFYSLAHAAFDFIEAEWGRAAVLRFLFAVRQRANGSPDDIYVKVFERDRDAFDREFDAYVRSRF